MTDAQSMAEFETIYRDNIHAVRRYLRVQVRGNESLVDDLSQQVFLDVLSDIDAVLIKYFPDGVEGLLITMARNKAIDHFRRTSRIHYAGDEFANFEGAAGARIIPLPPPHGDPLAQALSSEFSARFWSRLCKAGDPRDKQRLTDAEYRVALMAWLECKSVEEIALELEITPGSVYTHRSRARQKIEAIMNTDEYLVTFRRDQTLRKIENKSVTHRPGQVAKEK
ncbi:RNA polymerase sigma factor [Nocardia sp. GCM10030253]|uniref:RNA polymerase sigma factor n=1 Tax=Nocardia sp. GCM10030253 TaxID=3273404 RepID=UPI00363890BF